LLLVLATGQSALAFQDKAEGVFDTKKPGADKPSSEAPKPPAVSDRDTIGFTQQNVAAQMSELEERMFRLSEALQSLEPENASRLKLALNFSREELILLQMKEMQKLLRDAELNKAETEVRELLAKLEHLRTLLLAEDLDFQMKLARLRQMRETLGQLERIIKEERRELTWSRTAVAEQRNDAAEFRRLEQDQARNRVASDALAETSARLGDSGVTLQKDLIRAGSAMRTAEQNLAKIAAQPASEAQVEALKELLKTHESLARAVETLLVELRTELQSRIITELAEMHEIQADLRETTQAQAPRVAQRSRTALVLVIGLAHKESELGDRTEHLCALVEETEFGIALPTALRVLAREMRKIQEWLAQGDPSPPTVALEKRVEDDLLGLLAAIRRLPPTTPPPTGSPLPTDLRARERELNRLIAELKMIRLLQFRLNDDTTDVDQQHHPATATLTPELKREIEMLKSQQEEIRDSIARLSKRFEPDESENNQ
jgi:hypothetical protein